MLTRDALAPFGCEDVVVMHGGQKVGLLADELTVPKLPVETISNDEQGPSASGQRRSESMKTIRIVKQKNRWSKPQASGEGGNEASVGGASSLNFNFVDEDERKTVGGTREPVEDENFELEAPSALMNTVHNKPESSSPGNLVTTLKNFLTESTDLRKIGNAVRVLCLRTLPEEEWVVQHRDHENKTG